MIGIVAEFNPFHKGHKHLIETARALTGDGTVVCAMSGSMVQRGDVAIFDKWQRARAAIDGGADLVAELPAVCVLQSAENFALGGVRLLQMLGADKLCFGCECADADLLKEIAKIRLDEPTEYKTALKCALNDGAGYPKACEIALKTCITGLPDEALKPNSTLAASYITAAMRLGADMEFVPIKRIGGYHDESTDVLYPSATAIRKAVMSGQMHADAVYDIEKISALIIGFFRLTPTEKLGGICGMEPGMANRMKKAAAKAGSVAEFVENCISKRCTAHRIRRVMLCALLGIREFELPSYVRVLAFNEKGAEALRCAKANGADIVTKAARYNFADGGMFQKDILATDVAALCLAKEAGRDFTTQIF